MIDRKELEELAKVATDGPWMVQEDETYCGGFGCTPDGCHGHSTGRGTWVDGPHITENFEGAGWDGKDRTTEEENALDKEAYDAACNDAAFIAAANPQTVLELLSTITALEEREREMREALKKIGTSKLAPIDENDEYGFSQCYTEGYNSALRELQKIARKALGATHD